MRRLHYPQVRLAVLHHSAHEPDGDLCVGEYVQEIRRWHLNRKKPFSDIGYHAVVKGKDWEKGRPLPYQGAHCTGWNEDSIGICVAGDFTKRTPTPDEVRTTAEVVRAFERTLGHRLSICGHNELDTTLCPGPDLVRLVRAEQDLHR